MPAASPDQLVIPTFKGVEYPDTRIVIAGALDLTSSFVAETFGDPKPGQTFDNVAASIEWRAEKFGPRRRREDGMLIVERVRTVYLTLVGFDPVE